MQPHLKESVLHLRMQELLCVNCASLMSHTGALPSLHGVIHPMDSRGFVTFDPVDDDIVLSGNVTITLTIVEVSPPIVAIDPIDSETSVVILDDESEWIGYSS